MPFQLLRLIFFVAAAAYETLLLHLGASLVSIAFAGSTQLNWPVLLVICMVGAWTTARFEPVDGASGNRVHAVTLLLGAAVVGYGAKLQAGGGWSTLSGWAALLPGSAASSDQALGLPALLLICLAAWWRGMVLIDHDHHSLLVTLQRGLLGMVALVLFLTPVSITNLGAPPWGQLLAIEATLVVGAGLVSLSLARITQESSDRTTRSAWHWFRSSLGATVALMVVGIVLLSLVSDTATAVVRTVVAVIGGIAALIFAPIAGLLLQLWQTIVPGGANAALPLPSASSVPQIDAQPSAGDLPPQFLDVLISALVAALYLLPLLALIVVIVLLRRQRRAPRNDEGELHESLWSWQAVGADLLSVLKGLRSSQRGHTLRNALSQLRTDDPAQRIRRRYVQLLLAGEERQRQRLPQQTPLEHEAALVAGLPQAEPDLHALTLVYDRARYAPDTVTLADAAAADAAWSNIQAQATKENC